LLKELRGRLFASDPCFVFKIICFEYQQLIHPDSSQNLQLTSTIPHTPSAFSLLDADNQQRKQFIMHERLPEIK
jgi:hypothetical protein